MSKKEREFEFIKPLKEKPMLKPKVGKVSFSQKVVQEFLKSGLDYAEVTIPKDRTPKGIVIGLGRFIKLQRKQDEIEARIDMNNKVVLLKKK